MQESSDPIWRMHRGDGPLVATAIHDGHQLREELHPLMALEASERLREEDPHTGAWTSVAPNRVVGLRSRFEADLNRPREKAIYRTPDDAWGMRVWRSDLPEEVASRSLAGYDRFYLALGALYQELAERYGQFVVFDLHTYNHRREGPDRAAVEEGHPQVNVGTGTMNRAKWGHVVDRFINDLREFDFPGGSLDVRENIKFFGGEHARWTHANFPDSACVLAIEFKKFFMCEWSAAHDTLLVEAIGEALASTTTGVFEALGHAPAEARSLP